MGALLYGQIRSVPLGRGGYSALSLWRLPICMAGNAGMCARWLVWCVEMGAARICRLKNPSAERLRKTKLPLSQYARRPRSAATQCSVRYKRESKMRPIHGQLQKCINVISAAATANSTPNQTTPRLSTCLSKYRLL